MEAKCKWKCKDGSIVKLTKPCMKTLCWAGSKPRDMTPCKVTFLKFGIQSYPNCDSDEASKLTFSSDYLRNGSGDTRESIDGVVNFTDSKEIELTIGISSVTEWDRLIDLCLTKMVQGETATFSMSSTDSSTTVEITLKLVEFEGIVLKYSLYYIDDDKY